MVDEAQKQSTRRSKQQQAGGVKPTPPAQRTPPTGEPTPGFIVGKAFHFGGRSYAPGDLFVPGDHDIAERRLRLLVEHRRLTVRLAIRK